MCQDLGMHVDTVVGWRLHELGVLWAEFDLDSRREANTISRQVFVNICLAVKFCSSWIELHANPSAQMGSPPLFLNYGLASACATSSAGLASLRHLWRKKLKKDRKVGRAQEEEEERL